MTPDLSAPLHVGPLRLGNRIVATAHGSGAVAYGLAGPGDAEYWRRCAAGGAAAVIAGGTVVSPDSANRAGNITEAWRPAAIPGLRRRAAAIAAEGALPVCQLVHLGRETLGAELWSHPVGPSAVRSPREPTRPRAMTEADIERVVADFGTSVRHAVEAGFPAVELHAAHGYLLAQFLSPASNHRADAGTAAGRAALLLRLLAELRGAHPELLLGVRVSLEGAEEAGFDLPGLVELLGLLDGFDYLNVTAGVRTTYVKDMATEAPPLLAALPRLRAATTRPLLVSQAFRERAELAAALRGGADLVGMARPFIADPDIARKLLRGEDHLIRPCVSCNEDCRAFTPVLLCTVNPELAPPGAEFRPAQPLRLTPFPGRTGPGRGGTAAAHPSSGAAQAPARTPRVAPPEPSGRMQAPARRIAVVGAGPAGLEAAFRLRGSDVTLFEAEPELGGQLRLAALAPHRAGWTRLLRYYAANLDGVELAVGHRATPADLAEFTDVILATGAIEATTPGAHSTTAVLAGAARPQPREHVVVVDDGFGYWPALGAVDAALAAGAERVTVLVPGPAVAAGIPAESRVQWRRRLLGKPVEFRVETTCAEITPTLVVTRDLLSGRTAALPCDRVVIAGERISTPTAPLLSALPQVSVQAIGDALTPRRVAHAIAEGRAAAHSVLN
ncbi:FAD-dependent oxidoreductase [Nocardia sp. NPDC057353]|uniref:oxidoreductase n=1 Tax=Nocardia sp. NPDC057353 TaxID=3346104 RepID=UPI00363E7DD8